MLYYNPCCLEWRGTLCDNFVRSLVSLLPLILLQRKRAGLRTSPLTFSGGQLRVEIDPRP